MVARRKKQSHTSVKICNHFRVNNQKKEKQTNLHLIHTSIYINTTSKQYQSLRGLH